MTKCARPPTGRQSLETPRVPTCPLSVNRRVPPLIVPFQIPVHLWLSQIEKMSSKQTPISRNDTFCAKSFNLTRRKIPENPTFLGAARGAPVWQLARWFGMAQLAESAAIAAWLEKVRAGLGTHAHVL